MKHPFRSPKSPHHPSHQKKKSCGVAHNLAIVPQKSTKKKLKLDLKYNSPLVTVYLKKPQRKREKFPSVGYQTLPRSAYFFVDILIKGQGLTQATQSNTLSLAIPHCTVLGAFSKILTIQRTFFLFLLNASVDMSLLLLHLPSPSPFLPKVPLQFVCSALSARSTARCCLANT